MTDPRPIRLSFVALLGWLISFGLVAGGIGLYPAIHYFGTDGILAGIVSYLAVLAVMLASSGLVIHRASQGSVQAVMAFAVLSSVRVILCVGLLAGISMIVKLPPVAIIVCAAVLYLAMLAGECIWLIRGLINIENVPAKDK